MRIRHLALILTASLALLAAATSADTTWVGGDGAWETPTNWDSGLPDNTGYAIINTAGVTATLSNANVDLGTYRLLLGGTWWTANNGGNLDMTGGSLTGARVHLYSTANLNLSGGAITTSPIYLYENGSTLNLSGTGVLNATTLTMNNNSVFNQTGGTANFTSTMYMGNGATNNSIYTLEGGTLNVTGGGRMYLGYGGSAFIQQTGGTWNSRQAVIGVSDFGIYRAYGGTYKALDYDGTGEHAITIGLQSGGSGLLAMGSSSGHMPTTFVEDTGVTGNIVVGNGSGAGLSRVQGYGAIDFTGTITMRVNDIQARVTADGWDTSVNGDTTLDLSSFAAVTNPTDLAVGTERSGFFAQNQGRLQMPTHAVAAGNSSFSVGDDDGENDLMNSILFTMNAIGGAGDLDVAILSEGRAELDATGSDPVSGTDLIGIFDLDGTFDFGSGDMTMAVRYEDTAVTGTEGDLKLWHYTGGAWVDITGSIDTTNKVITSDAIDNLSYFAVANTISGTPVPEPTTLGLLGLGGLAILRRRSR